MDKITHEITYWSVKIFFLKHEVTFFYSFQLRNDYSNTFRVYLSCSNNSIAYKAILCVTKDSQYTVNAQKKLFSPHLNIANGIIYFKVFEKY